MKEIPQTEMIQMLSRKVENERNSSDRNEMLSRQVENERNSSGMRCPPDRLRVGNKDAQPLTNAQEHKVKADEEKNVEATRVARTKKVVKRKAARHVSTDEDSKSGSESARKRKRRISRQGDRRQRWGGEITKWDLIQRIRKRH
jgi:hypothetical protein